MSLTIITGITGAGKTGLATFRIENKYLTEGKEIWRRSCALIREQAEKYGREFSLPEQVPIYTNYHVKLHVGYNAKPKEATERQKVFYKSGEPKAYRGNLTKEDQTKKRKDKTT